MSTISVGQPELTRTARSSPTHKPLRRKLQQNLTKEGKCWFSQGGSGAFSSFFVKRKNDNFERFERNLPINSFALILFFQYFSVRKFYLYKWKMRRYYNLIYNFSSFIFERRVNMKRK